MLSVRFPPIGNAVWLVRISAFLANPATPDVIAPALPVNVSPLSNVVLFL